MKIKKNNLDEMQEQELLKVEHNGCWLAFWGLLAAMVIQSFVFGNADFRINAGEWVVFIVLALYMAIACVRRGIWDRRIPMNTKTNVILSAIAALALSLFTALMVSGNSHDTKVLVLSMLIPFVCTFVLCLGALTLAMKQTEKRQKQLEAEPDETDRM